MTPAHSSPSQRAAPFWRGTLAMMPLNIAVIPWGILAGSFAIDAGLTNLESQAMSAILFAGSAQLVATGMFKSGATLSAMLLAVLFITSRHLLYSVTMRSKIIRLPLRWRLSLGFLLTDELFAICGQQSDDQFNPWYALGAGLSFYLCWNLATLVGILSGNLFPGLNELGLEFAVAATFIALVVPNARSYGVIAAILTAVVVSVFCQAQGMESGLIIASLSAMTLGYVVETALEKRQ